MIDVSLKTLRLAIRFFTGKRVMSRAAALTYSTMLATVPILAVLFAIARGFGYDEYLTGWLRKTLEAQPQVAEFITSFVDNYLSHTKSGVFLGFGLLLMLYTVLMLVSNIEQTFNEIWNVKKSRGFFRTCTDYLAMFFLLPIFIVVMMGLSIFLATIADNMPGFILLGTTLRLLIDVMPYLFMCSAFTALYIFMPNTHVRPSCAVFPGILAGVAMQALQYVYINSQVWLASYNAIYGSFAALPLFMLWVQISWTICLFGSELTYINQNLSDLDYNIDYEHLAFYSQRAVALQLMSKICRRFQEGPSGFSAFELSQQTGIPKRVVDDMLFRLIRLNLLEECTPDEKEQTPIYKPAEDISNITVGMVVRRLMDDGTKVGPRLSGVAEDEDCLITNLSLFQKISDE